MPRRVRWVASERSFLSNVETLAPAIGNVNRNDVALRSSKKQPAHGVLDRGHRYRLGLGEKGQ